MPRFSAAALVRTPNYQAIVCQTGADVEPCLVRVSQPEAAMYTADPDALRARSGAAHGSTLAMANEYIARRHGVPLEALVVGFARRVAWLGSAILSTSTNQVAASRWRGVGLPCRPTLPRRSRRQGLRARGASACGLRPSSNPDCCAASWCSGLGQSRPKHRSSSWPRPPIHPFPSPTRCWSAMSLACTVLRVPRRCCPTRGACSPTGCGAVPRCHRHRR